MIHRNNERLRGENDFSHDEMIFTASEELGNSGAENWLKTKTIYRSGIFKRGRKIH